MTTRKLVVVTQNRLTAAALVKRIGILAALAGSLSGCMGSTGWRFEVGVSPVKQLNNQAGLTQEGTNKGGVKY